MANFLTKLFKPKKSKTTFRMISQQTNSYYVYNRKIYASDIVRSCLRPYVKALGKTVALHVRQKIEEVEGEERRSLQTNPDVWMRFMLEEPNPYMTFQKMVEKMATCLKLNNNAFAVIIRDENGIPRELYPMPAVGAEAIWLDDGELAIRFYLQNGSMPCFRYKDVIHLRGDYYEHDIFGDPIAPALIPLMDCVGTMDSGLINAIKNSAIIRWILKVNTGLRDEDLKEQAKNFAKNYLEIESESNVGVAATDAKADIIQVEPKDYVPNAALTDRTKTRIMEIFNTNEKVIQSRTDENEWNAYYESEIEPDIRQMSDEFTRKLFTRRERSHGNKIIFEAYNLTHASFKTKLELVAMVDRGAMTLNEWREVFNLAPVPDGDVLIRRLDTAVVNQIKNLANRIQGKDQETDRQLIATINRLIEGKEDPYAKALPEPGQSERLAGDSERNE